MAEWQQISRRARNADLSVTTERDLVKLEAFPFEADKLVAVRIRPAITGEEQLLDSITAVLKRKEEPSSAA